MTTLLECMLELGRATSQVYDLIATESGSTTTIKDKNAIYNDPGLFEGGTIWFLEGNNTAKCYVITGYDNGKFTVAETLTSTIAGDVFAVATNKFPRHKLKQKILDVLRFERTLLKNDDLVVLDDTEEYTLPSGVDNIMAVDVAQNTAEPWLWRRNYYWKEHAGSLIFDPNKQPTNDDYKIRLWYEGNHGVIAESGSILSSVNIKWLVWKAAANLYRDELTRIKQDNPMEVDLMNEAKSYMVEAILNCERYELRSMNPSPRLSGF